MLDILLLIGCYILGGIPFGVIVGKVARGIDIRDYGSGNIGASNVLRTLGTGPALVVFFFDTVKGLAAVLVCDRFGGGPWWVVGGALACILGHNFSVFLKFKGGKGVATGLGVMIGLNWLIALIGFGIWLLVVGITRYISVASVIAAASMPVQMVLWKDMNVPLAYQVLAAAAAVLVVVKHISNFKRLIRGAEPRIGQKLQIENEQRKEG